MSKFDENFVSPVLDLFSLLTVCVFLSYTLPQFLIIFMEINIPDAVVGKEVRELGVMGSVVTADEVRSRMRDHVIGVAEYGQTVLDFENPMVRMDVDEARSLLANPTRIAVETADKLLALVALVYTADLLAEKKAVS